MRTMLIAACAAGLWLAGGCGPTCPKTALTRRQLIERHNANARAVPRLWARAKIALTMTDAQGRRLSWGSTSGLAGANGLLLFARGQSPLGPHDFVLIGRAAGATELFRVGNSARDGVYYLWYNFGDHHGAMWGRDELAGAPGVEMPLDPMQILSVLNVTDLPEDLTALPTVTLLLSERPCAYVLTYVDRQPVTGEILSRRETLYTWDDRKPPLPYRVRLFDPSGRCAMTAELADYKPVRPVDPSAQPGLVPTNIRITWPHKQSQLHLVLSEMTTEPTWERSQLLFSVNMPRSIAMEEMTQVDKGPGAGERP